VATYRVQTRDTINGIARRFGISPAQLLAANPEVRDPNLIRIGQELTIPVAQPVSPDVGGPARSDGDPRQRLLAAAAQRRGIPYRLPPDGVNNLDCSLFVLKTFESAGLALPPNVRTAEQIRQVCAPIGDLGMVRPGDLLFFEHTYEPDEAAGPDGRTASHVGISLGAGSGRMWDCHCSDDSGLPGVGETDISTSYWQQHLFEARRPAGFDGTGVEPVVAATGSYRLTSPGVRLRAQPGTGQPILVPDLGNGTVVSDLGTAAVEADGHRWRQVRTSNGTVGWVAAEFLARSDQPRVEPPPPERFQIIDAGVRLRERPGTSQRILLENIGRGAVVTALSAHAAEADGHSWLNVRTSAGLVGWVARELLRPAAQGGSVDSGRGGSSFTPAQIARAIGRGCPVNSVTEHWPRIVRALQDQGIADRATQIAAIATVGVESTGFEPIEEIAGPHVNWDNYGGGRRYHGRGFIQLTHLSNYTDCGAALGLPDLANNPDLALDPDVAARVFAWYFKTHPFRGQTIPQLAAQGDWDGVRRAVNGGINGWDDFIACVTALQAL
jgi:predicted chitinase/murein DD-endopeptidase MepM/ murein hydrolase activator NlpD